MIRFITSILLIFNTLVYSQQTKNHPIDIPFTLSPNGHIIIPATVNGVEGNFVFDTGAGINLMTQKFANKVTDLEETKHFYTGYRATGEQIVSDLWKSKILAIGDFDIKNESFAIFDFEFPLDGLISLTPFKDKQITIDFKNNLLRIESEESLKEMIKKENFEMPLQIVNDRDIKYNSPHS